MVTEFIAEAAVPFDVVGKGRKFADGLFFLLKKNFSVLWRWMLIPASNRIDQT